MKTRKRRCAAHVLLFSVVLATTIAVAAGPAGHTPKGVNWPGFRGPGASGIAEGFALPVEWDIKSGKNIKWRTKIPGLGHASPAVWADRVFVVTAVSENADPYLRVGLYGESPDHPEDIDHDFRLYCLDKKTGKVLWSRTAHRGKPKVKRHIKASHANCTPATDGKHVVAFFGSEGLYCFDMEGNPIWQKDLGLLDAGPANAPGLQWAFASSPVIHEGKVLVQCDARNQAFVASFDVATGKEVWRTKRDDDPCWGTPTPYKSENRHQVIVNGYKHIGGYDFATGAELWRLRGGGDIPVPTPIVANDLIYITNAHGGQAPVYAIRTSATGDITLEGDQTSSSHIAWSNLRIGNYMQTPLVYGDELYCCRDNGILKAYDAATGKKHFGKRLSKGVGYSASPVAGDGKIYFTSEEGDVFVLQTGREYKLLAENTLGEICMATPAISEGLLIYRTKGHLLAIGK